MVARGSAADASLEFVHRPHLHQARSSGWSRASLAVSVSLATIAIGLLACGTAQPRPASTSAARSAGVASGILVRVNQVGFPLAAPKTATVLTRGRLRSRAFRVMSVNGATVLSASVGRDRGAWNGLWRHAYPIDFTALHASGSYRIVLSEPAKSALPSFRSVERATLGSPPTR